jgi:methyl-accepting chemotaxis protein
MPSKSLKSIESAEKDVVKLSNSLKAHKKLIEEFDAISREIVDGMNDSRSHSEKALEHLLNSTSAIERQRDAIVDSINRLGATILGVSESNLKTVENVHELASNQVEMKAQFGKDFSEIESLMTSLLGEIKGLKDAEENRTIWNLFRRKKAK